MKNQKGVALPVALILFVVMLIGALYLARSSSSGALMAGNLSYQYGLSRAADVGLFAANGWLGTTHEGGPAAKVLLDSDQADQGYVSAFTVGTPQLSPEDAAFWTGSRSLTNVDGNGTNVEYIIYRLCSKKSTPATDTTNKCVSTAYSASAASGAGAAVGTSLDSGAGQGIDGLPLIHYLITSRVSNGQRGISIVNQLVVMMGA